MEPCTFAHLFPFVPTDVLCRIHDVLLPAAPLGTPSAPPATAAGPPPGETFGPLDGRIQESAGRAE